MGGITDPVDGSGSQPAWMARVSKPDFSRCSWLIPRGYRERGAGTNSVRAAASEVSRRLLRNLAQTQRGRPGQTSTGTTSLAR